MRMRAWMTCFTLLTSSVGASTALAGPVREHPPGPPPAHSEAPVRPHPAPRDTGEQGGARRDVDRDRDRDRNRDRDRDREAPRPPPSGAPVRPAGTVAPGPREAPQHGRKGERTPPPEVKPAREELAKSRPERAKERRERLGERWGSQLGKPEVREELTTHERRRAQLAYLESVAESRKNTSARLRATGLLEKENARHLAAMRRLTAGEK